MHSACRAQFLLAAVGASLGVAAEAGLAREAPDAAFALAARPPEDALQRAAKRLALRPHAAEGTTGLAAAMVCAVLAHDVAAWPSEGPRPGVPRAT